MGGRKAKPIGDPSQPLKDSRHEAFCQFQVLVSMDGSVLPATHAAVAAGYAPKSARSRATKLLTRPEIAARIEWLKGQAATAAVLTREAALRILTDLVHCHLHDDGRPVRLIDFADMKHNVVNMDVVPDTPGARAVLEMETKTVVLPGEDPKDVHTTKIKLGDPVTYIAEIAKLQGWYPGRRFEGTLTPGGGPGSKGGPVYRLEFVEANSEDVQQLKTPDDE